ncbi:MAG: tryptophan synthase subunit alpha [Leptospirillum sp.]
MTSRSSQKQDRSGKKIIPYLMAGDPDLSVTRSLLLEARKAGVWAVELGIPFSDPTADGPVIQKAAIRALSDETSLLNVLSFLGTIPLSERPPVFIMTYFNLFLAMTIDKFIDESLRVGGVAGAVIPDLSFEDAKEVRESFKAAGLALVPFISPTTSLPRIKKILATADGFIYFVSLLGTTGKALTLSSTMEESVRDLRARTKLPVCVGFGIQTPEMAQKILDFADGVIVGSRLVQEEKDPVAWGNLLRQFCEVASVAASSPHQ